MKKLNVMMALLLALIISILTAGCGDGSTTSTLKPAVKPAGNTPMVTPVTGEAPTTVDGDYLKTSIVSLNTTAQPVFSGLDNCWDAKLPKAEGGLELSFYPQLAGMKKRGGPGWDFVIWATNSATNYQNTNEDLKTFTKKVCSLKNGVENQSYIFLQTGRFLVRAYNPGTTDEVDTVFLNINQDYSQSRAQLTIAMPITNGAAPNGDPRKCVEIIIRNTGDADAENVNLNLGSNYQFPNTIEASVREDYGSSVSTGPISIDPNTIYELGSAEIERDYSINPCSDAMISSGLPLGTIKAGAMVVVYCKYMVDPFADGKGMKRKVTK